MSENEEVPTEPVQIPMGTDGEEEYTSFDANQKIALQSYDYTKLIALAISPAVGRTIESIALGFVPPEHPQRGTFDLGWRVLIFFKDEDTVLSVDPTAAYGQAFMSRGQPEDVKFKLLLEEIQEKYEKDEIRVLPVPEGVEEE